jgi:Coenzyme PQQ synthesis protein D (PqqD)
MPGYRVNEPQVVHQTVDEETVIVDLGTGSYYSLRGSAQVIWSALERGLDVPHVVDEVSGRFEGSPDEIGSLVESFVSKLAEDRLIVGLEGDGPVASPEPDGVAPSGDRPAFEAPVLERFDDLQDLILLDPVHEVSEEQGWPHARPTGDS